MSELAHHLDGYLRARRGLGFKLVLADYVLPRFVAHLDEHGTSTISAATAVNWVAACADLRPLQRSRRLTLIRSFAVYMQAIDPATEIPPSGIWPASQPRPTPYLWSPAEIEQLLTAARHLRPPLRATTFETLFGLLAVSGMRVGEALGLRAGDIDSATAVITIRATKTKNPRLIPLHPTTIRALNAYTATCDRLRGNHRHDTVFVSLQGTPLNYQAVLHTYRRLLTDAGIGTPDHRPRIHDLRHSFAVRTLIAWHRDGGGIDARMPVLSTYLGHINPVGTYWYLSAAPELMELAAARLEHHLGANP